MKLYNFAADALVVVHLLWVCFMVLGIIATAVGVFWRRVLRIRGWRWVHLIGVLFSATLGVIGRPCPLTTWEYALRRASGAEIGAEESFVIRVANRMIFPDLEPATLSILTVAAAALVVGVFIWKPPHKVKL